MSNLNFPLPVHQVVDAPLDFVNPSILVRQGSAVKSFQVNIPNSFSNSSITTRLEVSSVSMLIDRHILIELPVSVSMTGSRSDGANLLQSGCQAVRSQAFAKACQNITIQLSNVSYTFNSGDVMSAFEHYNLFDSSKYNADIGQPMLDQYVEYDNGFGSNRNPLQLYSTGMNSVIHRGSQLWTNIVNSPSSASWDTVIRAYIPCTPLHDMVMRQGGGYALAHTDVLNLDITFVSNLFSRMFSFCTTTNGSTLTITSGGVNINQPVVRFVQLSDQYGVPPEIVSYPLKTVERYNTDFTFSSNPQPVSSAVIQISRVPESMYIVARPSNNTLISGAGGRAGAQISDCFCPLQSVNIFLDGQTLLTNASQADLWKMSTENGLVDNFLQFSGSRVLTEISSANGSYAFTNGAPVKLVFNKDIVLAGKPTFSTGNLYKTNLQVNCIFNQTNPSITNWSLYLVLCYSDVIQLYGSNNAVISNASLTDNDVLQAKKMNQSVHYDVFHGNDLSGGGLMDCGKALYSTHKILPMLKHVYEKCAPSIGSSAGGAISGGAMAKKLKLKHNLLM